MRQQLFNHVQRQSFRFFDNTKTGHIMSRITNDLFDIGELAHHGPEDFFIAIMTLIGAFVIMYSINPELALIAIVMVPLLIVLVTFCNMKMNAAWRICMVKLLTSMHALKIPFLVTCCSIIYERRLRNCTLPHR